MKTEPDMLGTMPMGKLIARMSIPLMVSMLIQSMYNIVDSIFVSKLGQEAISAMGIAFPVQMLMIALANGLGVGMNALISQRFGRGQTRDAARAAGNTLCLSAVLTLVFMIFGYFGTEVYFKACATDPKIIAFGVDYLRIVCIGCVGIFFVIMSERLLQVTGKTALSMTTQLSGAVINIILDPILIFGLFGFPKLGIAGAAIATVVGQIFAAIFGYILHLIYNHSLQLHCSDLRISRDILTIVQVGLPASVTMAMGSISTFGINKILQASVVSVSVVTVFFRLQSFLFMPLQGMMQGLIPIIGFNYGAKSGKRLQEAIHIGVKVSLVIMIAGFLLCELFPTPIFGLFTNGEKGLMLDMGVRMLRIVALTFPVCGVALVLSNVFQGMGNGMPSMIYGVMRQCVLLLPAVWIFWHFGGTTAVWFAFWVAEFVTAAIILLMYRKEHHKRIQPLLQEPTQ